MKNTIRKIIAIAIVLTCTLTTAHASEYPQAFTVTALDQRTDTVTVTTASGFDYSFFGIEDWMLGDIAAAIMDNNGTEDITDDRIVDIRYAGYIF